MKESLSFAFILLTASATTVPSAHTAPRSTAPSPSWVKLRASTDKTRYATGDTVAVRLLATNTFKRGAYLRFTSSQHFDFSVLRAGTSDTVYTWSASRMFMQSLGSLWIKPRQSQNFEASIGDEMGTLKPGKYLLRARLTNTPRPIEAAPVTFEIVAPALSMSVRTDKTTYKIGEAVKITAAATNDADAVRVLHFDSGLGCDFIVSNPEEATTCTYGALVRFARALGDVSWNKGETKTYSTTWDGHGWPAASAPAKLTPGRYKVQAVLQSTPQILAPPVYIELVK